MIIAYANGKDTVCPPCATPAEVEEHGGQSFVVILKSDEWADAVVFEGAECIRCGKRYDEKEEVFR